MITFKKSSAVLLTAIVGVLSTFIPGSSYANDSQGQESVNISMKYEHKATDSSDTNWSVFCTGEIDNPHDSHTHNNRMNVHFIGHCYGDVRHLVSFSPTYWSITWPYAQGLPQLGYMKPDKPPLQRAISISRPCLHGQRVAKGAMFATIQMAMKTDNGHVTTDNAYAWNNKVETCGG